MFTGLVETRARIRRIDRREGGLDLWIEVPEGWDPVRGQSVSVSGACLSIAGLRGGEMLFEVSAETLSKTWIGSAAPGDEVNLERAMRLGDRLDGHLVTGHV